MYSFLFDNYNTISYKIKNCSKYTSSDTDKLFTGKVGISRIGEMFASRAGTPDEVGDLAEFLMSSRGRFISGADFLIDGGCTASYWYGDLQYLKATH